MRRGVIQAKSQRCQDEDGQANNPTSDLSDLGRALSFGMHGMEGVVEESRRRVSGAQRQ
jgi:hypothetical protein